MYIVNFQRDVCNVVVRGVILAWEETPCEEIGQEAKDSCHVAPHGNSTKSNYSRGSGSSAHTSSSHGSSISSTSSGHIVDSFLGIGHVPPRLMIYRRNGMVLEVSKTFINIVDDVDEDEPVVQLRRSRSF